MRQTEWQVQRAWGRRGLLSSRIKRRLLGQEDKGNEVREAEGASPHRTLWVKEWEHQGAKMGRGPPRKSPSARNQWKKGRVSSMSPGESDQGSRSPEHSRKHHPGGNFPAASLRDFPPRAHSLVPGARHQASRVAGGESVFTFKLRSLHC